MTQLERLKERESTLKKAALKEYKTALTRADIKRAWDKFKASYDEALDGPYISIARGDFIANWAVHTQVLRYEETARTVYGDIMSEEDIDRAWDDFKAERDELAERLAIDRTFTSMLWASFLPEWCVREGKALARVTA